MSPLFFVYRQPVKCVQSIDQHVCNDESSAAVWTTVFPNKEKKLYINNHVRETNSHDLRTFSAHGTDDATVKLKTICAPKFCVYNMIVWLHFKTEKRVLWKRPICKTVFWFLFSRTQVKNVFVSR